MHAVYFVPWCNTEVKISISLHKINTVMDRREDVPFRIWNLELLGEGLKVCM